MDAGAPPPPSASPPPPAPSPPSASPRWRLNPYIVAYIGAFVFLRSFGLSTDIGLIFGTVSGLILSLPPYWMALRRRRVEFAERTLWGCVFAGLFGGPFVAAGVAIALTLVIASGRGGKGSS